MKLGTQVLGSLGSHLKGRGGIADRGLETVRTRFTAVAY